MSSLLLTSVALFTIAMMLYTTGVWSERAAKRLKAWHVWVFSAGVFTDIFATIVIYRAVGGLVFTLHAIMGFISLGLMILHFIWAIIALFKNNEKTLNNFHKLSIFVWSIWMISYLSGFVLGVMK